MTSLLRIQIRFQTFWTKTWLLSTYFLDAQDDDTNYHMDLIAGLANMRARNYGIPEVNMLKAKWWIIPEIATSSAMATGLVCLELYKVIDGEHKLEDYRNTFADLELPPLNSRACSS